MLVLLLFYHVVNFFLADLWYLRCYLILSKICNKIKENCIEISFLLYWDLSPYFYALTSLFCPFSRTPFYTTLILCLLIVIPTFALSSIFVEDLSLQNVVIKTETLLKLSKAFEITAMKSWDMYSSSEHF